MGKAKYARWTSHCTGCCELGEYQQNAHLYPWDEKAQCRVGSGCSECGYTGKRRHVWRIPEDVELEAP